MELAELHAGAKTMGEYLRLRSHILAVKMLPTRADAPKGAIWPKETLGKRMDLCQSFCRSRWEDKTMAMTKEDMWCFEPVVGYGLAERPKEFLEGGNRFPDSAMTVEAAKVWAQNYPALPYGRYKGVACGPLHTTEFMPDVVVVYCDPAQLTHIMIAKNAIDGGDVMSPLSGHAACVYAVVPTLLNGTCNVALPCRGDRRTAMTQDNEIIFAMPTSFVPKMAEALIYLDKHGWEYPWPFILAPERELLPSYVKLGGMIGMDYEK